MSFPPPTVARCGDEPAGRTPDAGPVSQRGSAALGSDGEPNQDAVLSGRCIKGHDNPQGMRFCGQCGLELCGRTVGDSAADSQGPPEQWSAKAPKVSGCRHHNRCPRLRSQRRATMPRLGQKALGHRRSGVRCACCRRGPCCNRRRLGQGGRPRCGGHSGETRVHRCCDARDDAATRRRMQSGPAPVPRPRAERISVREWQLDRGTSLGIGVSRD